MTYQEIVEKYKVLFIMLVEKAGRETGNTSYLNVSKLFEGDSDVPGNAMINSLVVKEPRFKVIVCSFIVLLLTNLYGVEKVKTWDDEQSATKLSEFYKIFLKKATLRFCQKYGLEEFEDPETSFKLVKLEK
jgi:hypothetical protein